MKRAACLVGILFLLVKPGIGGTTANITGIATHDGTPLAGVMVRILSPAMQGTRTTTTDINGLYAFVAVPPGEYTVSFEAEGMQSASTKVTAGVGQTGRADAAMLPTKSGEQGIAGSVAAGVETKAVQTNLSASIVDVLPIGRDPISVMSLAPGTNGPSISGGARDSSLRLMDGGVATADFAGRFFHPAYVEDAISETTLVTAAIPAEYGRFSGGVVNSITKSGGNDWSGSFRDSFSNPSWTARTPYQNISNTDKLEQTLEATFGGRVLRDRLWFFTAGRYFADTSQRLYTLSPSWGYTARTEDQRAQLKLTGQLAERHSIVASLVDFPRTFDNQCGVQSCVEPSVLASYLTERRLTNAHYTGVFGSRLVAEAFWSLFEVRSENRGSLPRDPVHGTWGFDVNTEGLFGANCVICDPRGASDEVGTYGAKASWYVPTTNLGTHTFVGGYDHWAADHIANSYQSSSDFGVYTFSEQNYDLRAGDVFRPVIDKGDQVVWMPIVQLDRPSNQQMHGLFLQDGWELGIHWSLNLGLRNDLTDLVDESGFVVSDTSALQPRAAATWDLGGDGRFRVNASYARYADLLTNLVGSAAWPGGKYSELYWDYAGPRIEGLSTTEAFARVFDWFNAQCDSRGNCGTSNMESVVWASGGGVNRKFGKSLRTAKVDELSAGFSVASAPGGYLRLDAMTREWSDFLVARVTQDTGQTTDAFGNPLDWRVIENSDAGLKRHYEAVLVQGELRVGTRWNFGGNYTWSRTTGNVESTSSSWSAGPEFYPELLGFPQRNPIGYLPDDQRHKLRAWGVYDLPTKIGAFDVSILESFDSGRPYSMAGAISTNFDPAARAKYANEEGLTEYYFGGRGALRWSDVTSTDMSLTYKFPLFGAFPFVDFSVSNVFNEAAQVGGNTSILTAYWGNNCRQTADATKRCALFNPFTETPIEGVHYKKGPHFGEATSPSHYQTPRTYSFSAGVRF